VRVLVFVVLALLALHGFLRGFGSGFLAISKNLQMSATAQV